MPAKKTSAKKTPAKKASAKKSAAKKSPAKKAPSKKTPAKKLSARRPGRPALVEYLLRLVWVEAEYDLLKRGGERAIISMRDAGLTPEQQAAVLEALKGYSAPLKEAVREECARYHGGGDKLWNVAADFIFGRVPPSQGGSSGT